MKEIGGSCPASEGRQDLCGRVRLMRNNETALNIRTQRYGFIRIAQTELRNIITICTYNLCIITNSVFLCHYFFVNNAFSVQCTCKEYRMRKLFYA